MHPADDPPAQNVRRLSGQPGYHPPVGGRREVRAEHATIPTIPLRRPPEARAIPLPDEAG